MFIELSLENHLPLTYIFTQHLNKTSQFSSSNNVSVSEWAQTWSYFNEHWLITQVLSTQTKAKWTWTWTRGLTPKLYCLTFFLSCPIQYKFRIHYHLQDLNFISIYKNQTATFALYDLYERNWFCGCYKNHCKNWFCDSHLRPCKIKRILKKHSPLTYNTQHLNKTSSPSGPAVSCLVIAVLTMLCPSVCLLDICFSLSTMHTGIVYDLLLFLWLTPHYKSAQISVEENGTLCDTRSSMSFQFWKIKIHLMHDT